MIIHNIIAAVTIIMQIQSGLIVGSATGFFYESNNRLFLVTNKHVVYNESKNIIPDKLLLRLHTDQNNVSLNDDYEISLYDNDKPKWKVHNNSVVDISLIMLDKSDIKKRFFVNEFSKADFLPEIYALHPSEDIFIMGYPQAFYDEKNNLPIFRNGMIASTYGANFQGMPLFLTDANIHPGTSGSPIITKSKNSWVDNLGNVNNVVGTQYFLLGINSGNVDTSMTNGVDIGLGAGWYAKLIEEIVDKFN